MNLKPVFLLVSVCVASHIFSSDSGEHGKKKSKITPPSSPATKEKSAVTPSAQSTTGTHLWYGTARVVGGKTFTAIFNEKYASGKLKGDLIADPTTAVGDLNSAVRERFKDRDPLDSTNQEKIYNIFKATQAVSNETSIQLELAKALAAEYNALQKESLEKIVAQHAIVDQPAFIKKRDDAIALANNTYDEEMKTLLTFANHVATSKRYLHLKAEDSSQFDMQKLDHYKTIQSYSALLEAERQKKVSQI